VLGIALINSFQINSMCELSFSGVPGSSLTGTSQLLSSVKCPQLVLSRNSYFMKA